MPEKARKTLQQWPTPNTKQQIQQFLGAVGFWHTQLPNLATLLKPLHQVARKKAEWEWGSEQEKAFEAVKALVSEHMELHPILPGPVELHVSVSQGVALWSLWQLQEGRHRPLGFWSCQLAGAATRYTAFEQLLLAVYWALADTEAKTVGHEVLL